MSDDCLMMAKKKNHNDRRYGLTPVRKLLPFLTSKALRRKGFFESAIVHNWLSIVGNDVGAWCIPEKVTFARNKQSNATLHLAVFRARALEIQHLEPVLLQRINAVFGYDAVSRLSIRQTLEPLLDEDNMISEQELNLDECEWISRQLKELEDSELKQALRALGKAIMASKK